MGPIFFLSLAATASGCKGSSDSTSTTAASASAPAATTPAAPPPPPPSSSSAFVGPANPEDRLLDLQGRFKKEASTRPSGTPRVEDVYAAFVKAGFSFEEQQQHLASPFGAIYCVGGKTKPDIAVSVCEYAGVDEAQKGKAESAKIPVPNRELFSNGATTLTVRVTTPNAESDAAKKKLVTAFAAVPIPKKN